jgi:hypothetical protein
MQYCGYDASPIPEPKPQPAPTVLASSSNAIDWMHVKSASALSFEATTSQGKLAVAPVNQIHAERYAVYWKLDDASEAS